MGFFQLAKGDDFSSCQYATPDGRTFISNENGQVVDENSNIVAGVEALLEINNLPVCGLKLTNFSSNYFGWWSCKMQSNDPKSTFHKGTFKINKPNEWPTEIRLPTDVKVIFHNYSRVVNYDPSFRQVLKWSPISFWRLTVLVPRKFGPREMWFPRYLVLA